MGSEMCIRDRLKTALLSLREQLTTMARSKEEAANSGETGSEIATLKETLVLRDREIQRLKSDLALLRRDRSNLQRALKVAAVGITTDSPAPAPAPAAATPAVKPDEPKVATPTPTPAAAAPVAQPESAAKATPPAAQQKMTPWTLSLIHI